MLFLVIKKMKWNIYQIMWKGKKKKLIKNRKLLLIKYLFYFCNAYLVFLIMYGLAHLLDNIWRNCVEQI